MNRQLITSTLMLGMALALGSQAALAFDEDASGTISPGEALEWSKTDFGERFGEVDEVAVEDFQAEMANYDAAAIDEDGNGMISLDEWNAYAEARYSEAGEDEMEVTDFEDWTARGMQ